MTQKRVFDIFKLVTPYKEYRIVIHKHHGEIKADSEWGMLRGLESLAQMISTVDGSPGLFTQQIHDWPEYKHRGLMVDTARHFLPVTVLKQLITSIRKAALDLRKLINGFNYNPAI